MKKIITALLIASAMLVSTTTMAHAAIINAAKQTTLKATPQTGAVMITASPHHVVQTDAVKISPQVSDASIKNGGPACNTAKQSDVNTASKDVAAAFDDNPASTTTALNTDAINTAEDNPAGTTTTKQSLSAIKSPPPVLQRTIAIGETKNGSTSTFGTKQTG